MAIVRYQGNPMQNLFDELEDLVSSSFDMAGRQIGRMYPQVDISEDNNGYRISADIPGMNREDIRISVENGVLTISGEKKRLVEKTEKEKYYHFERNYGKFSRSFNLPLNVDPESIQAKYQSGVLEIFVKKTEESKPKSIEIKVE